MTLGLKYPGVYIYKCVCLYFHKQQLVRWFLMIKINESYGARVMNRVMNGGDCSDRLINIIHPPEAGPSKQPVTVMVVVVMKFI